MRPGDALRHPWKYLRRDVPHIWYVDERFPLMGFLNRDEATLLHNIALQFAGRPALEIGSWLGWSTCHLAMGGVELDVIDPQLAEGDFRADVERSLEACGVAGQVTLVPGSSPEAVPALAAARGRKWSLFFIDGDHEAPAPARDALACLPYAAEDCAFVFHDLASPAVTAGLRTLADSGFHVVLYQTAQIMAMAWRGDVVPVAHVPDPEVAWQVPAHLIGLPIAGVDFQPPRIQEPLRELSDAIVGDGDERPSVCIVTNEIIGPFKNGGIGTAMTGLAELLAADGVAVTVLYTGTMWAPGLNVGEWRRRYAEIGIELETLSIDALRGLEGPMRDEGFGLPWLVYRYLAERRFDVIHFNDCCGEGSLSLAAKKLGLAFGDSLLTVALHSPSEWVLELNQTLPTSRLLAAFQYAERLSVRCADLLWSPSRYLLDWIGERGFTVPDRAYLQRYAMPLTPFLSPRGGERVPKAGEAPFPAVQYGAAPVPKEIVFFGRLEERKGLRRFCNAIHLLRDELAARGISVTFLGKPATCAGIPSLDYIARRAASWQFPTRTLTDLGQPEALEYLRGGERLAVMPSPFDNSPCTVYEALAWGVPFLAARTGGIPELVAAEDRGRVLFHDSTEALRAALAGVMERGGWIARPAVEQEEIRRTWTALHREWRRFAPPPPAAETRRHEVIAVVDHRAGDSLDAALQTLAAVPSIRRVCVLNRAGEQPPAYAVAPWLRNIDLLTEDADALMTELAGAEADLVLLLHSGVRLMPEAFAAMLRAADVAGVDGLLPAARVAQRIIPPLGGSASFALFEGVTFTGAMLVRRDVITATVAGRALATESPFLGLADFCVARSAAIWPYPEVVVEWPEECRVEVKSGLPARIIAYGDAPSADRYYMLAAGYGAANRSGAASLKRELARALVDLGVSPLIRLGSWGLRRARRVRARLARWVR
ncbi:MAG TPA: class I SAM-dependent methyltransferase [Thermoanaerobaculia bacterium]|nr:class I SAM-dependent methyltransferase [Thermoanaerobaculia bacterium]